MPVQLRHHDHGKIPKIMPARICVCHITYYLTRTYIELQRTNAYAILVWPLNTVYTVNCRQDFNNSPPALYCIRILETGGEPKPNVAYVHTLNTYQVRKSFGVKYVQLNQ